MTTLWSSVERARATCPCRSSRSRIPTTVGGLRYIRRARSDTRIGADSARTFIAQSWGPVKPAMRSARFE